MPTNSRHITTKIESCHRHWLAKILGLQTNGSEGIDLFDDILGIELKCKLLEKRYQTAIPVANYQYEKFEDSNKGRELFWAFLYYRMSKPFKELHQVPNFEPYVISREIYFQPWDFLILFPPSKGKLETWRYVRRKVVLNSEYNSVPIEGGTLHLPLNLETTIYSKPEIISDLSDIPF